LELISAAYSEWEDHTNMPVASRKVFGKFFKVPFNSPGVYTALKSTSAHSSHCHLAVVQAAPVADASMPVALHSQQTLGVWGHRFSQI